MFSNNPYRRSTSMKAADMGSMLNLAAYIGNSVGVSAANIECLSLESLKTLQQEEGMFLR